MSGKRLRALSTKVTGTLAPVVSQAAEGVVQLTDESLKFFDYASAGDPITNLATDLERLSHKDDDDSFIDDGASDIENRAEIESDLQGHGFMAQFKPMIHRYKNWTRQMKRFCPAVPETVSSKIDRVYWIDVLRIIACLIVPIVHAKNYTGTYGLESERHPGFWFCGYDANDPAQVGNRVYTTAHHTFFQIELQKYLERKYMTGFMTFFFASGAAMFLSMRRTKKFWPSFFYRIYYLCLIVTMGSLLCVIPVNVIYYGAHGTEPWKVDPTQHLGFLFTLLGFTVAATPAAWGMIKQSFMGWMIELVVILVLTIVMVVTGATGGMAMEIAYMWLASIANIVWILVSSYIVSLRDFRFPVTVIISIMTWSIPESMDDIWSLRSQEGSNLIGSLALIVSYYLIPFVLGFAVVAFPTKATETRTWLKVHLAMTFFIISSPWTDPVVEDGWMEAWSIRTYDSRLQRALYTASCWWVVIFMYNIAKSQNACPYPKFLALFNKYTLFLFVFHPLFLSILACYVIVYTNNINMFVETILLYVFALVGCFIVFILVFMGLPFIVRMVKGKAKNRRKARHTETGVVASDDWTTGEKPANGDGPSEASSISLSATGAPAQSHV